MTISSDDVYLKTFRKVGKSFVEEFLNAKDHVHQLLEGKQRLESGRFREELLMSFLRRILPKSVSVDTGFIYGFEKMENSRQLDSLYGKHGESQEDGERSGFPLRPIVSAMVFIPSMVSAIS